jgi:hypothetical protein
LARIGFADIRALVHDKTAKSSRAVGLSRFAQKCPPLI